MSMRASRSACLAVLACILSIPVAVAAKTIYVDDDAVGANDGTSWGDAYFYLQDALMFAVGGDEIRVAQGVYRPDDFVLSDRANLGQEETFQLIDGVILKGGYAGLGEADPNARDVELYETILSGDLNGDDGPGFANNGENSFLVVTGSGTGQTAVLDGFTITGANGRDGGGMYNYFGDPTVINCTFMENRAELRGGGMYNRGSSPTITNCLFIANSVGKPNVSAGLGGGGAMCNVESNLTLANCIFIGNVSVSDEGGGISNYRSSEPMLVNCTFSGNSAGNDYGGGMYNGAASPVIINCTFSGNSAKRAGGGVYNRSASSMLMNCVLWANSYAEGTINELAQIAGDSPVVRYSCIQGLDTFAGEHNIGVEPLFVDSDGADNLVGTRDDDLRLNENSFCINAGNNSVVPSSVVTDLDGNPRITHQIVDMGAYENPDPDFFFFVSNEPVTVPEGQTATFDVALMMDPNGSVEVTVACEPGRGDVDITVEAGTSLRFDSSDYSVPQTVTLAAAEDIDNLNGTATIRISSPGFVTTEVIATEEDNDAVASVIYVDDSSPGINTGSNWGEAYRELRDAMAVAAAFQGDVAEIRVAQGIYRPAESSGDRKATFRLINGVSMKGGYAGLGSLDPDQRDIESYETVLSGDLNGDDSSGGDKSENSYHVVSADEVDANTIMEGFTITGGNADDVYPSPHYSGGGMLNSNGSPVLIACTFRGNYAREEGGGMCNSHGSPTINNCKFRGNVAGGYGGGMSNSHGTPRLTGCVFDRNSSNSGGGVYNSSFWYDGESLSLIDCTFTGNYAYGGGGAMSCNYDSPTFINCIFSGNSAGHAGTDGYDGGAILSHQTSATLLNCTFSGNSAYSRGGAMLFGHSYEPSRLTNCILWGNDAEEGPQIVLDDSGLSVSYCDIQGGQMDIAGGWSDDVDWGAGNIDCDPCFAKAGRWDVGVWLDGDYHLKSQAGRWDAKSQSWLLDDVTSPCIDAGDPMTPIAYEPFSNGGIGNMGAYGGTVEASKSYFGKPPCEIIVAGDINGDCTIDFRDFQIMALHWCEDNN